MFEKHRGQRHAGGHQHRRQPQAAGRMPRRRAAGAADRIPRALPEVHSLRGGGDRGLARGRARRRRDRPDQAADPAAIRGRCRALHHRRPDHGARSGHRRRHHRLSPPDAQGQEPARRLAAFTPAHVRIPSPRRGARPIAAGGDHDRHPSAALHGLDGLRLSAARAQIRDHRRPVRRALSFGALRRRRPRSARRRRNRHRRRNPGGDVQEPEGPFSEFTGYASLPKHAERLRRPSHSHAARRDVSQRRLRACRRITSWFPASRAKAKS